MMNFIHGMKLRSKFYKPTIYFKNKYWMLYLGFLRGRDCATFCDKGKEVSSLSCIKGTTGQAQNLAMGCDRPGQAVKIRDRMRDWTITIFLSKSGTWVILSLDVPGQRSLSRDFCSCPFPRKKGQRDKEMFLFRDKGTTGRPVPDCSGTSRPLETLVISYCSFIITPMADTQVAMACAYVTLRKQIHYVYFSTN